MAQEQFSINDQAAQSPVRTVEARFHCMEAGAPPLHVQIEGTVYRRDDDQADSVLFLRTQDTEAALLALMPDYSRQQAQRLLMELADTRTERSTHREEVLQARMVEYLPQHKAIIDAVFDPEENDIPLSEFLAHRKCVMIPATWQKG